MLEYKEYSDYAINKYTDVIYKKTGKLNINYIENDNGTYYLKINDCIIYNNNSVKHENPFAYGLYLGYLKLGLNPTLITRKDFSKIVLFNQKHDLEIFDFPTYEYLRELNIKIMYEPTIDLYKIDGKSTTGFTTETLQAVSRKYINYDEFKKYLKEFEIIYTLEYNNSCYTIRGVTKEDYNIKTKY